jgi:hypothetical protein
MEQAPHQTSGDEQHKRLVVGWFSFTCSEDSTILFTELLNDHLDEWRKVIEFRYMKALKTNNSLAGLDVAFIEGAISSESRAKEAPHEPHSLEHHDSQTLLSCVFWHRCSLPICRGCTSCLGRPR